MYVELAYPYQQFMRNVSERAERSLGFGELPSSEIAQGLVNDGVDYFVFDLRRGLQPDQTAGVNVLYENDFVRLVNLNDYVNEVG